MKRIVTLCSTCPYGVHSATSRDRDYCQLLGLSNEEYAGGVCVPPKSCPLRSEPLVIELDLKTAEERYAAYEERLASFRSS